MVDFLNSKLEAYAAARAAGAVPLQLACEKEGALGLLGSFHDILKRSRRYRSQREALIMQHVVPELGNAEHSFLRYRAAWFVGMFADLPWSSPQNAQACLQALMLCLRDPELPVKVSAAATFQHALDPAEGFPSMVVDPVILPHLSAVLESFFQMMGEVGVDEVVTALAVIIDRFSDEMPPYAQGLATSIIRCFQQYAGDATGDGSDADDDAGMAAYQCLDSLGMLLNSIRDQPACVAQLEGIVLPVMGNLLHPSGKGIDFLDSVFEVIYSFAAYSPGISNAVWSLLPPIYYAIENWAPDYIEYAVPAIDRMITRGTREYVSPQPQQLPPAYDLTLHRVAQGMPARQLSRMQLIQAILQRNLGPQPPQQQQQQQQQQVQYFFPGLQGVIAGGQYAADTDSRNLVARLATSTLLACPRGTPGVTDTFLQGAVGLAMCESLLMTGC